jgi:hypothetical protein
MQATLSYSNIIVRNVCVYLMVFCLILLVRVVSPDLPGITKPTIIQAFTFYSVHYLIIFFHNVLNVKANLLAQQYAKFTLIAIAFISICTTAHHFFSGRYAVPANAYSNIVSSTVTLLLGCIMYIAHTWVESTFLDARKQIVNQEAELIFLKQQLSPHFLLNSLNNLYGVSLSAPNEMPDRIMDLSNLLRYQLAAANKDIDDVATEVAFVDNYLQYAKYKANKFDLQVKKMGCLHGFEIPTLLYLPLIENAIKFSAEVEVPCIRVIWEGSATSLKFSITNNHLAGSSKLIGTTIGLTNLKRRLEIYSLNSDLTTTTPGVGIYNTCLTIWTKS